MAGTYNPVFSTFKQSQASFKHALGNYFGCTEGKMKRGKRYPQVHDNAGREGNIDVGGGVKA